MAFDPNKLKAKLEGIVVPKTIEVSPSKPLFDPSKLQPIESELDNPFTTEVREDIQKMDIDKEISDKSIYKQALEEVGPAGIPIALGYDFFVRPILHLPKSVKDIKHAMSKEFSSVFFNGPEVTTEEGFKGFVGVLNLAWVGQMGAIASRAAKNIPNLFTKKNVFDPKIIEKKWKDAESVLGTERANKLHIDLEDFAKSYKISDEVKAGLRQDETLSSMKAVGTEGTKLTQAIPIPTKPAIQAAKEADDVLSIVDDVGNTHNKGGFYNAAWKDIKDVARPMFTFTSTALKNTKNKNADEILKKSHNYIDIAEKNTATALSGINKSVKSLSKKEYENYVDVLLNEYNKAHHLLKFKKLATGIRPMNSKVRDAARITFEATRKVTKEAKGVGLEVAETVRPFFPLQIARLSMTRAGQALQKDKFIQHLVRTKQVKSKLEAENLFKKYAEKYAHRKFAGLEQSRTIGVRSFKDMKNLGFNVDRDAWFSYFMSSNRRIQEIKQFSNINPLLRKLKETHPQEAEIAERMILRLTHRDMAQGITARWAQAAVNFHVITFMGMAGILQLGALGNVPIRMGALRSLKGLYKGIKSLDTVAKKVGYEEREFAQKTGAIFTNIMSELRDLGAGGRWTDAYLRMVGVTKLDEFTRLVAVHAGKPFIDDMVKALAKNPTNKYWSKAAKELLLDPKKLAKTGLQGEDYLLALKRLSDSTVGRVRPLEMTHVLGHPYAKLVTLFKNYLLWHSKFVKDQIFKKPERWLPALAYQYPLGFAIGEVRAKWKGVKRPEGLMWHIDNFAMVQAFGIIMDFWLAASRGGSRAFGFLAGPIASNISEWASTSVQTVNGLTNGKEKPFKQFNRKFLQQTVRPIPYIGPPLYTELLDQLYPEMKIKERKTGRR